MLAAKHMRPLSSTPAPLTLTASDTGTAQPLDVPAMVRAWQAISAELDLDTLAATVVRVSTEEAAAPRGALLLVHDDTLTLAACVGGEEELPWSVFSQVKRTREPVLLADTTLPHPFSSDPCFERGQLRSVLCLPLVHRETLHGVLYLGHPQSAQAFSPARLALLGPLAAQAAISLENARRHAELAQRLEESTRERQQALAKLVEAAREVGKNEMAAQMLVNADQYVTSTLLKSRTLRQQVDASRMVQLKKLTLLLEEHQGDLVGFLTQTPRGTHVMAYLFALADELQREHTSVKESAETLEESLEWLHAILRCQAYAPKKPRLEECELAELVEDLLHVLQTKIQSQGITVIRELLARPKARVDINRVKGILSNLLANAIDAMSEVPEARRLLRIRLEAEGSTVRFQVVDSGKGIAPEHRERLFSQGFTTRADGHGLGLYVSAHAVQALGGRLTLDSEGPGLGATATLEFPLT